jgi:hypothetical protein
MTISIGSIQRGTLVACAAAIAIAAAAPAFAGDEGPQENQRARVIEEFDSDGDGRLSETERKAAREARGAGRGMIEKFDTDGDGVLSTEERKAFNESDHGKRRAEAIAKYDTDGNGKLSDDERKAARTSFGKEHGKGFGRGGHPPKGGGPPDAGEPSER